VDVTNSDLRIRRSLRDVGERSYTNPVDTTKEARSMSWSRTEYVARKVSLQWSSDHSSDDMNEVAGGRVSMGD
jgi:hypothetical protein